MSQEELKHKQYIYMWISLHGNIHSKWQDGGKLSLNMYQFKFEPESWV
jgi:hypothetical protein